jgi:predicted TPR repeat methyltransferase
MSQPQQPNIFSRPLTPPPVNLELEQKLILSLFQQGRLPEAERASRSLSERAPKHGFAWKALGLILSRQGRKEEALQPMQQACKLMPRDAEAFNNLGSLFEEFHRMDLAESCYRHAIDVDTRFGAALDNLIRMLEQQQKLDTLIPLLQRKLELDPHDGYIRHRLDTLQSNQTDGAPSDYVASLFDSYAEQFDHHLQNGLGYRAPFDIVRLIDQHAPEQHAWRVVDLGCGTGLVAEALAGRAQSLVGVDLSEKMLSQARARGDYTQLACADVLEHLRQAESGSADTVIATDVFVYVGKVDEVVAQAHRVLSPGGLFAFTVEDMAATSEAPTEADLARGHRLESSGRYSHADGHLRKLAERHGFKVLAHDATVIRHDKNQPLHGQLVLWQR